MIKEITFIIAIATGIIILALAIGKAWDIQDRMTCQKLQQQEKDYPTFYSTAIEKEMCKSFGITLNK
jgi:hypothetical protein